MSLPINQDGATLQNAPHEGFTPKFPFEARLFCGTTDTIISARYTACPVVSITALALAALVLSLALSAALVSHVLVVSRRIARVRVVPPCRQYLASCDFAQFHRSRAAGRSLGAVVLLMVLLGSSTPILWQIGLDGVRVGGPSHPGPAHPSSEGALNASNVPETLIQVPGSDSGLPAAHSGAPAPGSPCCPGLSPLCCSSAAPPCFSHSPQPLLPLPLCLMARLAASPVLRPFAAAAVAPPSALLQFTLRTSPWVPVRPDCSARSRLVRITLTLLTGGSHSKRCGPTSRHTSRASSWVIFLLIGFGATGSAHVRSVTVSYDSMGAAPRAFIRFDCLPLPSSQFRGLFSAPAV